MPAVSRLIHAWNQFWMCYRYFLGICKGLVTNYGEGGATKREGGASEVLPLRKGGAEKVLAMLKGGTKSFGVVYTQ